jgi:hypothetical protein
MDIATVWHPLLATPSTTDLMHRKPASAETSSDKRCAQDSNEGTHRMFRLQQFVRADYILCIRVTVSPVE